MGNIQVMSSSLANQIAAGEVVERPASCLKELLENSLDAGATELDVTLADGGISQLIVQDNGWGMDELDAMAAFSRHATSKLFHAQDLFRIRTLGFRGEALAAIASVARVTLETRQNGASHGVQVIAEASNVMPPTACSLAVGTRIEVRDLFFNTPARLKYLRAVNTEQARCVEVIQRASLSRPDVSFRCTVGSHVVFYSPGRTNDARQVLLAMYGGGESKQLLPVSKSSADYQLNGFVGRPTQARSARHHGYLFVNGRPIRNYILSQSVLAAYHPKLMTGRYPLFALYLTLDPLLVDVNIHPHKAEVRFSEERDVAQFVQTAVRESLEQADLVESIRSFERTESDDGRGKIRRPGGVPNSSQQVSLDFSRETVNERSHLPYEVSQHSQQRSNAGLATSRITCADEWRQIDPVITPTRYPGMGVSKQANHTEAAECKTKLENLRLIGQGLGMYILADDGHAIYIIDQHAAHEKVLYEKFLNRLRNREVGALSLLVSLPVSLSPQDFANVKERQDALSQLGLCFEEFGDNAVIIRTVPDVWEGLDLAQLAEECLQDVAKIASTTDVTAVLHNDIALRACKAAVKANDYLAEMEMHALLRELSALDDPFHCPHGRPIIVRMDSRFLEKEFRRIV